MKDPRPNVHYTEDDLSARARALVNEKLDADPADAHLSECVICSQKLEFFVEYYKVLAHELELPGQEGNARPSGKEYGPIILTFAPFHPKVPAKRVPGDYPGLILAAQDSGTSTNRFIPAAVYSSTDPPAVLRVIEDCESHDFKVFVLSETPKIGAHVRLTFVDDTGRMAVALTDDNGHATVEVPLGFNWKLSQVGVVSAEPNQDS